jgi:hypothetical protein
MADYIWYPVTGDGQTSGTAYVWNGAPANWNTPADWGLNNLLDLTSAPPPGDIPGSGTGGSSGFGLDNAYIVAGQISSFVFAYYAPDPTHGDPYIASNNYPVDITISTGTIGIANLSLAAYNALADAPTSATVDVEGATLEITGGIFNSVSAVVPTVHTLFGTVGGDVTATGGGTLELGTGAAVEIAGSVQANIELAFVDGAGDRLTLAGLTAADPTGFAGTIDGFVMGDTIDLSAVAYTGGQPGTIDGGGALTLTEGAQTYTLQFDPALAGDAILAAAGPGGNGTDLTVACFAAGTRIMTEWGEIAVEALAEGDRVATTDGTAAIVWLGHRRIDCRRHPRQADVQPVRVTAGAIAPGVPRRDLLLSPDHAVFLDGALIPVRYLVNGITIMQQDVDAVTYWHVELPSHAVLMAEGLACESYLDTGNRAAFANGGAVAEIAPSFARAVWDDRGCAPLVADGPALLAVRQRLLARALELGHALDDDPGLHLVADGRVIRPRSVSGLRYRFALTGRCGILRLASRAAIPAETAPDGTDHRRLGVMVTRLAFRHGDAWRAIPLDALRDADGWHPMEAAGGWRWTRGDALLASDAAGPLEIEVQLGDWARAWRRREPAERRARA